MASSSTFISKTASRFSIIKKSPTIATQRNTYVTVATHSATRPIGKFISPVCQEANICHPAYRAPANQYINTLRSSKLLRHYSTTNQQQESYFRPLHEVILENHDASKNEKISFTARLHRIKGSNKSCFMYLRDGASSIQVVKFASPDNEKDLQLIRELKKLPRESILRITGTLKASEVPIKTQQPIPSIKHLEVDLESFELVSKAQEENALLVEDAMLSDKLLAQRQQSKKHKDASKRGEVSTDVRLDNRIIDWRVPAHHCVLRIQSKMGNLFREFLDKEGFVEIHSPKLVPTASEGGSNVFKVDYFGRDAYLAQSPQLFKQMLIMSDCPGVYEIGPVFRAENSNTHRHLTEFVGLDMEMRIDKHYHEVLAMIDRLLVYIFENLKKQCAREIEVIREQYPAEDVTYFTDKPNLILDYKQGIDMLREDGVTNEEGELFGYYEDLTTPAEKRLGQLVKEKYGTDFFILDKYPMDVRPFYTMPHGEEEGYSRSYDIFLRGEEISSGAQRIHDPELLLECAEKKGVDLTPIQAYVNSFKHGAWPHGGTGIGLERLVFLYLGLGNVKRVSLFPRDPKSFDGSNVRI